MIGDHAWFVIGLWSVFKKNSGEEQSSTGVEDPRLADQTLKPPRLGDLPENAFTC